MKQLLVRGGGVVVEVVPAPVPSAGSLLVRVAYSCVSIGTETSSVRMSALPLYRRALKQPQHVRRVLQVAKDQGFLRTVQRVQGQLSAGLPTGYAAAGTVAEVGDRVIGFSVGDRVACAGAGVANHAEFISVPVNLAVKVPDTVSLIDASTATLGAIALQGVRRASPTLGETIAVMGLGLIGQLTVQLLRASGCRVIGVDPDPQRSAIAVRAGMESAVDVSTESFVDRVMRVTDGYGADAVVVTASTSSSDVIHDAMQACRKKGRVVLVGDVGLELRRADMYEKELDFLISTSYGPGRYDARYEDEGIDYPLPYVRWTENRNMEEYLHLIETRKVTLDLLDARTYPLDEAPSAYSALSAPGPKPMLVTLSYDQVSDPPARTVQLRRAPGEASLRRLRVALVGAGNFAEAMHLPNLAKMRDRFELRTVLSRTGSDAKAVAARYGAAIATTDLESVLADPAVDVVVITTRHDTHAELVLAALGAGKHVFVEKPLAMDALELERIERFFVDAASARRSTPVMMTGFNRRFAPSIEEIRRVFRSRTTPLVIDYQMNAGYIPLSHWVHGSAGGGRNIGEACHIYDLFNSLVGAAHVRVSAQAIRPSSRQWAKNDNFIATISFTDGSVCALVYTALGSPVFPKEKMSVFADGRVATLDNYRAVQVTGARKLWRSVTIDKGHMQELEAFARAISEGGPWPISLDEQLRAMRIAFEVESQLLPNDAGAV